MSTIAIWTPARRDIAAISQARQATVTTTLPHGYFIQDLVRFYIPEDYGMPQANLVQVEILDIPTDTTFICDLDSSTFLPFQVPLVALQKAQVVPVGEDALSLNNPKMVVTAVAI